MMTPAPLEQSHAPPGGWPAREGQEPAAGPTRIVLGGGAPEGDALSRTVAEQLAEIDRLATRIAFLTDRQRELRALLMDAHDQLQKRDDELERLRDHVRQLKLGRDELRRSHEQAEALLAERDTELADCRALVVELRAAVKRERERLRAFKDTRYWRLRLWVKRLVGRG